MIGYLNGAGFLRPRSSIGADLSLLVMIGALVMLTVGVVPARSKRCEAHRWVQTTAVTLSVAPVVLWMIRSFRLFVVPVLPAAMASRSTR